MRMERMCQEEEYCTTRDAVRMHSSHEERQNTRGGEQEGREEKTERETQMCQS